MSSSSRSESQAAEVSLTRAVCAAAIAAATVVSGCASVAEDGATPNDLVIRYYGTLGNIGRPMVAEPSTNCRGTWNYDRASVVRGSPPPGVLWRGLAFVGEPTRTGLWPVEVEFTNTRCDGSLYGRKLVRIRFIVE